MYHDGLGAVPLRSRRRRTAKRDWPIYQWPARNGTRPRGQKKTIPIIAYDTALTESAYGKPEHLGDLFNDVMGSVVPGWSGRPAWMTKIRMKPDPNKLIDAALKIAPPKQVEKVLTLAERLGLQTEYAGQPISPWGGAALYETGAKLGQTVGGVPVWVWLAGGGVLILFLTMRK